MTVNKPLSALLAATTLFSLASAQDISHRKADLTVAVQSGSGIPLEGATVEIEMLNHAFRFGCAVELRYIDPTSNSYDEFTVTQLQKYFNSTTYGNYMKWASPYYEGRTDEQNQALVTLAKSHKAFDGPDAFRLRGHVTVWGAEYQLPAQLKSNQNPSAETVHNLILNHVEAYHTTFKDTGIDNFDLYNEHFNVPQLLIDRIADPSDTAAQAAEVATWFNKAKEADPNAVLFINDFNILNDWSATDDQVKKYKAFIDAVRDAGGQIDGIGLQAHMDHPNISKAVLTRRLDLLAAPMAPTENNPNGLDGLRIEITELDMAVKNEIHNQDWVPWTNATMEDQVAQTDAVISAAFEHPAVDGITIWGLDDFRHWRGNAIMYDNLADGSTDQNRIFEEPVLKETGQLYIDKVTDEWWEDHSGSSSPNGKYTANTFKGTHRITVTFNGETQEQIVHLDENDTATFNFVATAQDASSYDAWAGFIDWGLANSARDQDPDLDGRNNFAEYADGTDPLAKDLATSPRIIASAAGSDSIQYAIRAADSGLEVTILTSTDLDDWQPYAIPESISPPSIEDSIATYTIPIPEVEDTVFYQIRITES